MLQGGSVAELLAEAAPNTVMLIGLALLPVVMGAVGAASGLIPRKVDGPLYLIGLVPALVLAGCTPPVDASVELITATPDPAVIEFNTAPSVDAADFLRRSREIYAAAADEGLSPYQPPVVLNMKIRNVQHPTGIATNTAMGIAHVTQTLK